MIIGLDLAEKTGIAVLDAHVQRLLWSASIKLAHRDSGAGLLQLRDLLHKVLAKFGKGEMAIEDIFLPIRTSRRTPIALGELRGVAKLCAAEANIPVFFYPPARIKMAITGSGRAAKEDVMGCIEAEFRIKPRDNNEADAIAVAHTHWLVQRFNQIPSVESTAIPG